MTAPRPDESLTAFRSHVLRRGRELYRDLPWRRTRDPYAVLVSEVMLQQTQVARVDGRWQRWLERFPNPDALAAADTGDVLEEWQGLGYNRRAVNLVRACRRISELGGEVPSDLAALRLLPGVGAATAAGVRAFAFDLPGVYVETNVRAVFLHELFPGAVDVPDSEIAPLVERTCPQDASNPDDDPRAWYYALLDYGAHLKASGPDPARRSRSHATQSRFEGSRRQKRAAIVRLLLEARGTDCPALGADELSAALTAAEISAGRSAVSAADVASMLEDLAREGLCYREAGLWRA